MGLEDWRLPEKELGQPGVRGWHEKNSGGENLSRPSEMNGSVQERNVGHVEKGDLQNDEGYHERVDQKQTQRQTEKNVARHRGTLYESQEAGQRRQMTGASRNRRKSPLG